MDDVPSRAVSDPETRRALQLDALAAILPMDRRDRLAQLLTDDDVESKRDRTTACRNATGSD